MIGNPYTRTEQSVDSAENSIGWFPVVTEDIRLLGISLCWLQIFDGFLTWLGVSRFGINFEGNPLLRNMMISIGTEQALVITKITAICAIIFICFCSQNAKWVKPSLIIANSFYLLIAVIPWIITLY
jgi:hypothetical protein